MPLYDFECSCGKTIEAIVPTGEFPECPECGEKMSKVWMKSPSVLTTIIPTYPGCKRMKAGYAHTSSADHPATRVQSGYGGCTHPPEAKK